MLARWLAEPVVARWWNHERSPEAVEREFGPGVDGDDATELFLACADDQPFGLIQRYSIDAYPEYVEELTPVCPVPPGALSVDYLIGEPQMRGQGLGAAMVTTLVAESWACCSQADDVIVPVSAGNHASWRTLERAGSSGSRRAIWSQIIPATRATTTSTGSSAHPSRKPKQ